MTSSYLLNFRFGYGAFAGRPELSSLAMPTGDAARYPNLTGSADSVRYIQSTRSKNAKLRKKGDTVAYKRESKRYNRTIRRNYLENADTRLRFTARSGHPFFERLVYFWLNHFAVATKSQRSYMPIIAGFENEAIRPHVDGNFRDLLRASALHPAMLLSLSQNSSVGPRSPRGLTGSRGLNENLGREILELYSLGADGGYTQGDVVELALLLTGLRVKARDGSVSFRPNIAEPGIRTIMGRRYGGMVRTGAQISAALDDLAVHPSTARHVARKLAGHFIADDPSPAITADLEAVFRDSGGHLPSVYAVLLDHGARATPFRKVRTPLDFVIAGLRAIGAPVGALDDHRMASNGMQAGMAVNEGARRGRYGLPRALAALSHELWGSPGPDGFPDRDADWLHADGLAARLGWATRIAHFVETPPRDFALGVLGDVVTDRTLTVIGRAASREEGIALALMSPEFNRR